MRDINGIVDHGSHFVTVVDLCNLIVKRHVDAYQNRRKALVVTILSM